MCKFVFSPNKESILTFSFLIQFRRPAPDISSRKQRCCGHLEEVWRGRYQDNLHKSFYRCREQSKEPDEATKALRSLARWIVQNPNEPTQPLQRSEKIMAAVLKRMGGGQDMQDILAAED